MPAGVIGVRSLTWSMGVLVLGLLFPATSQAQHVVVLVNGEPITALDIEQRAKLDQLSTHKMPARQDVIEELIVEKLKIREGKKWGLEVSDNEVDTALSSMAGRMRMNAEQLGKELAKSGVNVATLKHRIKA